MQKSIVKRISYDTANINAKIYSINYKQECLRKVVLASNSLNAGLGSIIQEILARFYAIVLLCYC